jgi:hypothetical protein
MKRQESKCQCDSRPLKVGNHPDLLTWKWHVTHCWKFLIKAIILFRTSPQSKIYTKSYGPPKWQESQFRDSQVGSPRQNDIWVQPLWLNTKNIIKKNVVVFPKFGPQRILWVCVCFWFTHAPKVLQLCTNQLIVWFVQIRVNNWPICIS